MPLCRIRPRTHNVISDVSGAVIKSDDIVVGQGIERGFLMSKEEFSDPNMAQLYVRQIPDKRQVPNVRLIPPATFLDSTDVYVVPPDNFTPPPTPEELP